MSRFLLSALPFIPIFDRVVYVNGYWSEHFVVGLKERHTEDLFGISVVMKYKNQISGFTLIELMIVIAIAAVLIGLAAPSFVESLKRNRLQMESEDLFVALVLARSEALKRNQPVAVCASDDGASCTSSEWNQGWIIYADENSDGSKQNSEPVMSVRGAFDSGDTLKVTGSAFDDQIVYRVDGTPSGTETFVFCDADEDLSIAREIDISVTGRPRSSKTTTDCTP